jgi:hypothetical protein
MGQKRRTAASSLSLSQIRAVGRMTINFNWMEHGVEVLIKTIVGDSVGKTSLIETVVKPHGFRQKLQILRLLVADLQDQYVESVELDRAYAKFAAAIKSLSSTAESLNNFRNNIVHWRPFVAIPKWERQPKFTTSTAADIDTKSAEMDAVGTQFFARAIYLYNGEGSLTFGTHVKK